MGQIRSCSTRSPRRHHTCPACEIRDRPHRVAALDHPLFASSVSARVLHAADLSGCPVGDVIEWDVPLDDGAEVAQEIIRSFTLLEAESVWAGLL